MAKALEIYPHFEVTNNKNPNKFYAFPIVGIIVKLIMLIPVAIWMGLLGTASVFILIINWFVILFTGAYWDVAYRFFLGIMRLATKVYLFVYGLTDRYPGFSLGTSGLFKLDIAKPKNPNRWFAIPFLGILARFILLFPYLIFSNVLMRGSSLAMVISWFGVIFKEKYPESLYEFERDSLRVFNATSSYMLGFKDTYPSFYISLESHQTAKVLLIIAGALLSAGSWGGGSSSYKSEY